MGKHLILGGGGFIGSQLGNRLAHSGHDVTLADTSFPSYREPWYKSCNTYWVNLLNMNYQFEHLFFGREWDMVWQLAADMGGVEFFHSDRDWGAAVTNQAINMNVMRALSYIHEVQDRAVRTMFTSTACAYAIEVQNQTYHRPLTEEDIRWGTPDQLYGQEKRNSALMYLSSPFDVRVAALHTVYGPGQEFEGVRMKFPLAVAQKARKARSTGELALFGDGTQVRTFLHIEDAVDRLIALSELPLNPGLINIGDDNPKTVAEAARIAISCAGATVNLIDHQLTKPTGVMFRSSNNTKAEKVLGTLRGRTFTEGMIDVMKWLDEVGR